MVLKLSTVTHVITEMGSLFHKQGAAVANAHHDLLNFGTARDRRLEERRPERDGLWTMMREAMYLGEENFNAQKVMSTG